MPRSTCSTHEHSAPPAGPTSPISPSSSLASDSPRKASHRHGAFDRAKSMFTAACQCLSLSRSSSPTRFQVPSPPNTDTLFNAYCLLEVVLTHYFPGTLAIEPDDPSVRDSA